MSLDDNNKPKNKDVQDQVKNLLSGLGGEAGEFLSQPVKGAGPACFGHLLHITLLFRCEENHVHVEQYTPEGFDRTYSGDNPQGYFDNFSAVGIFRAGPPPNQIGKIALDDLLKKAQDYEQLKLHKNYIQALADEAAIKISHLKVENDILRRELNRVRTAQDLEKPGETALDLQPAEPEKRRWTFRFAVKKIRVISRGNT